MQEAQSDSDVRPASARYRVEGTLGQGGIGVVYAVWDTATERRIALKRLLADQARARALFEREYRTLASLRHPGIVEVYEYGVDEQGPFYTMELLKGQDLTVATPMPWREVCECLRDIASIVGVLHARRLVHRDLSPRNVWRTPDGRIKLLDFGALARFGAGADPVGTPPLMAPEVLQSDEVDQRADLFSLGALGYWLLTSAHAFRAHSLGELPRLWEHEPPRPSGLIKLLSKQTSSVPEALDSLLLSLLSRAKHDRPSNTVELIESLSTIADLPPQAHDGAANGVLASKAFVGRRAERDLFTKRLRRAGRGRPQAVLVTGPEGIGRTRLLDDLAEAARVAGALVLRTGAGVNDRPYAAASALCVHLLKVAPEAMRDSAAEHAAVLRQVSPELNTTLREAGFTTTMAGTADRQLKQSALREVFCTAARSRSVVIVADDLHCIDEASQALLSGLPHVADHVRLLVLAASCTGAATDSPPDLDAFSRGARRLHLGPLTEAETSDLVQSVFSNAPHVERVAARLHQLSRGNPQHCLWIAQHLVDSGAARYVDGRWDLPKDVSDQQLPAGRRDTLLARLSALGDDARDLGRALSIVDTATFTADVCGALSPDRGAAIQEILAELVSKGVVEESTGLFRFAHPALREALHDELPQGARVAVELRLARLLDDPSSSDTTRLLRAGVHYLRAGEIERGHELVARATENPLQDDVTETRETAPLLAEAVDLLSGAGRDDHSLLLPLAALCTAGYFVDPSYASRYGERGMRALLYMVPTDIARRWQPVVGKKVALLTMLVVAGQRLRRTPYAPKVPTAVRALMGAAAALAGTEATRLMPALARRYAEAIQPLSALGKDHIAKVSCDLVKLLAMAGTDSSAEYSRLMQALIEHLESDVPIVNLEQRDRGAYLCSLYFIFGLRSAYRGRGGALEMAEKLDAAGPLYSLNADQLRAMHYTAHGDLERADLYRRRMGVQAIQMGMSWRVDTFAPILTVPAIWANDALSIKQAYDQLRRLSRSMPGFEPHARAVRAAYHVVRGKPHEAVALLKDHAEERINAAGWTRTRSILASAYNGVGDHAAALAVCDDALSYLSQEDLEYLGLTLGAQVERSLALAGLRRFDEARTKLDELLACHSPTQGPLVRSYLHRARASVALLEADFDACRTHLTACELLAREMNMPSLLAWLRDTGYQLRLAQAPMDPLAEGVLRADDEHVALRAQLTLRSVIGERDALQNEVVRIARELTEASVGYFVPGDGETQAVTCSAPEPHDRTVIDWARQRLGAEKELDQTTDASTRGHLEDPNALRVGDLHYCLCPFWTAVDGEPQAVGALVLGFRDGPPRIPAPDVLGVMLESLTEPMHHTDIQGSLAHSA